MTTFLQLHFLTSYPPANLNRDDTGRPKSCVFGGATRLRISSQSLKRAWRTSAVFQGAVQGAMGKRTQRIGALVQMHLVDRGARIDAATKIARQIADVFGKLKPEGDLQPTFTEQLVFVAPEEHQQILALAERMHSGEKAEIDPASILRKTDGAADIAMFGRMLADSPAFNREAAVQVAHALTTHKVVVEDDYYVAVDDLKDPKEREDAGTSFIGVSEFASGVFYQYACVDADLLKRNLGGNAALAADSVEALVRSAATVAPRGKIASFAQHARASFVMAEQGVQQPRSLATAFLKPVSPNEDNGDLALASIKRLKRFRKALDTAYGANASAKKTMIAHPDSLTGSLDEIVAFCRSVVQ